MERLAVRIVRRVWAVGPMRTQGIAPSLPPRRYEGGMLKERRDI